MAIKVTEADERVQLAYEALRHALGDPVGAPEAFEVAVLAHRQTILAIAQECRKTPTWQLQGEELAPALEAHFRAETPDAPYVAGFRFIDNRYQREAAAELEPNAGYFGLRLALPVIGDLLRAPH